MIEFPELQKGDALEVSASSFVAFYQCPESAAARYRGEFGPDSRAGFSGQLAHRIFARHLQSGPITPADLPQACREEIGSAMNPKVGALGLKPSEISGVISEVGSLYDRFKSLAADGFAGAEVELEAEPADGVRLRGKVDAIFDEEGGVRLVDWKTGGVHDESARQLDFYALLWALERRQLPARVEAVSVRTGERLEAVPGVSDIEATARLVAEMISTLRLSWASGEALLRTGGPWCRFCPLLDGCAEGRAAQEVARTT